MIGSLKTQNGIKTMKWITWGLLITLAGLQYKIWLHNGGLRTQYAQMQQQAESIKRENAVIRHDNAMLRAQVDDLQNGYEALSELARSELGYIEEGETYYNLKRE